MSSLYLSMAQCICAQIKSNQEDIFEEHKHLFHQAADKLGLTMQVFDDKLFIMNDELLLDGIASYETLDFEPSDLKISDNFENQTKSLLEMLASIDEFSPFLELKWSSPSVKIFATS